MPDKLLKDGLRTSAKIGGVPEFAELLFVRLLLATCHLGRCPWSPDWIRTTALSNRPRKRLTEIAAALETLRRAHLVARYTAHDGTAYLLIPNHGQRLKHAVRSPWPAPPDGPADADGQTFMAMPGDFPIVAQPPPAGIGKKAKPRVCVSDSPHITSLPSSSETRARAGQADLRPAAECIEELSARYPRHDLRACLAAARRYVRKERGEDAEVTVGWFVLHWMPKAAEKKPAAFAPPAGSLGSHAQREAVASQWQQEQDRKLTAIVAGPEPADKHSIDYAIWIEGRKSA